MGAPDGRPAGIGARAPGPRLFRFPSRGASLLVRGGAARDGVGTGAWWGGCRGRNDYAAVAGSKTTGDNQLEIRFGHVIIETWPIAQTFALDERSGLGLRRGTSLAVLCALVPPWPLYFSFRRAPAAFLVGSSSGQSSGLIALKEKCDSPSDSAFCLEAILASQPFRERAGTDSYLSAPEHRTEEPDLCPQVPLRVSPRLTLYRHLAPGAPEWSPFRRKVLHPDH